MKKIVKTYEEFQLNESDVNTNELYHNKMEELREEVKSDPDLKAYFDHMLKDSEEKSDDEEFWEILVFEEGYEIIERNPDLKEKNVYELAYHSMVFFLNSIKRGRIGIVRGIVDTDYYKKANEYIRSKVSQKRLTNTNILHKIYKWN